jgi:hypothetical protein
MENKLLEMVMVFGGYHSKPQALIFVQINKETEVTTGLKFIITLQCSLFGWLISR